jgi:hypothetical protein
MRARRAGGVLAVFCVVFCLAFGGCGLFSGYSDKPLFPDDISTIYVEMFENQSFWRGVESKVTEALAKRIEAETPYKIVSSRDIADSVIRGQILSVGQSVVSIERETGLALEREVELRAVVNWKNFKTAEMLLNNEGVSGSATYSDLMEQSFEYGSSLAANKMAARIVELMETRW